MTASCNAVYLIQINLFSHPGRFYEAGLTKGSGALNRLAGHFDNGSCMLNLVARIR
jgi:hypothetical protein